MHSISIRTRVVSVAGAVMAVALLSAPMAAWATEHTSHETFSLTVTPSTGLDRAGQNVTASGAIVPQSGHTGFHVKIAECKTTCTTVVASTALSTTGLYSTVVPVTLCEPNCYLKATIIEDTSDTASASIAFAAPAPTTTSLQLSATGAPSGSTITVPFGTTVHAQATVTPSGVFALNGSLTYTLYSDPACSVPSGAGTSTVLPTNLGADAPSVSILVPTPATYYWGAAYAGDPDNLPSSTTCGTYVMTVTQPLVTSITATPNPVTAGQRVQYTLTVTNTAPGSIAGVNVIDTLPSGTTLFSSSAGCAGSGTVTCSLGTLAGSGGTGTATLLVTTSAAGTIIDTATATPGTNNVASIGVTVNPVVAGSVSGFVPPGGSLDTGGTDPANLSLPTNAGTGTGNGAAVTMTQGPGNFCNGACNGTTTNITPIDGYSDPKHPVSVVLSFSYTNLVTATNDYLNAAIYKFDDATQTTGSIAPDCKDDPSWSNSQKAAAALRRLARIGTHSGIANPHPCVDARTINILGKNNFTVTFTVLYLTGDPHLGRK